jgi:hypothetical protein
MPATTPYPLLCPSVLGSGADRPPATVSGGMQPASHGGRARPDDIHGAQARPTSDRGRRPARGPAATLAAGHVADFGDDESDATPTRLPCPALLTDDDCYRSRRPGPAGPRRRSVL